MKIKMTKLSMQITLLFFGMVIIACSDSDSNGSSDLPTQLYISLDNKIYIIEHNDGSVTDRTYNFGKPGTHYKYEGNGDIIFALYDNESNKNVFTAGKIQNGQISLDLPTNIPDKYFKEETIFLTDSRELVAVIPDKGACSLGLMDSEQQSFALFAYASESKKENGLNFLIGLNIIYGNESTKQISTDSKIIKSELKWQAGQCRPLQ